MLADEASECRYVGTEEGVFELKMNYHSRKFWPAIEPR